MKNITYFLLLFATSIAAYACPVCERNQPKMLRGIVHGAGPETSWDYISVWITAIIALLALVFTIRWLIDPKEDNKDHIKYTILNK
jgi:hypothetical protein